MREEESITECANILSTLGCSKSAEQLSIFSNILAIAISRGKNANQLNVIGNFIVSVGGLILAMAAQIQVCESKQEQLAQLKDLKKQIKELEDSIS